LKEDHLLSGDWHCGHRAGLTPPEFWNLGDPLDKFGLIREAVWSWFAERVERMRPIGTLLLNGDALDGRGEGSGGRELLTTDRNRQVDIAESVIRFIQPARVRIVKGTPYHVGREEDWEEVLADRVGATVGVHEWLERGPLVLDCKHKVGGSSIPHGRLTALSRAALWNSLWAEKEGQPKANFLVRSHVHYHVFCGTAKWTALTLPTLAPWSDFGARQVDGDIDIGFVRLTTTEEGYSWKAEILEPRFMRAAPLPL
jgi:hypothetical protein